MTTPEDPIHARPAKPSVDELRYEIQSLYGLVQHGERVAVNPEARNAFHLVSAWLDRILWPRTAA
jgi:hypothetical protein